MVNLVILVMSFKEALKAKRKKPNSPMMTQETIDTGRSNIAMIKRWLKGWISLSILVGGTWVFGLFYVHESVAWFSYVFIVLNGLQVKFLILYYWFLMCS